MEIDFGRYPQTPGVAPEPIRWLVLRQGASSLLFSKFVLDVLPFHRRQENVTWADSDLRSWLNQDFAGAAFSPEERERLAIWEDDAVFLFSLRDMERFLPPLANLAGTPSLYARSKGYSGSWWLRDSCLRLDCAAAVGPDRMPKTDGLPVLSRGVGVRPCLWLRSAPEK